MKGPRVRLAIVSFLGFLILLTIFSIFLTSGKNPKNPATDQKHLSGEAKEEERKNHPAQTQAISSPTDSQSASGGGGGGMISGADGLNIERAKMQRLLMRRQLTTWKED